MSTICQICGKNIGLLGRIKIKDGFICSDCQKKSLQISNCQCRTAEDYRERFLYLEKNEHLFDSFSPTIKIGDYLQVDETNKLFRIGKSKECFPFSCLVNFELNEDGETITKGGLGSALVGGALLGGVGAVVGGVTGGKKTKTIVRNMYIRISLNDKWIKSSQINLINNVDAKKGGVIYNMAKSSADSIVSALEIITNQQDNQLSPVTINAQSDADELLKFKQLLDTGIITQEEFASKKKQLLGL